VRSRQVFPSPDLGEADELKWPQDTPNMQNIEAKACLPVVMRIDTLNNMLQDMELALLSYGDD
jgi:hypothetical protein